MIILDLPNYTNIPYVPVLNGVIYGVFTWRDKGQLYGSQLIYATVRFFVLRVLRTRTRYSF